jgi:hypothetical protein
MIAVENERSALARGGLPLMLVMFALQLGAASSCGGRVRGGGAPDGSVAEEPDGSRTDSSLDEGQAGSDGGKSRDGSSDSSIAPDGEGDGGTVDAGDGDVEVEAGAPDAQGDCHRDLGPPPSEASTEGECCETQTDCAPSADYGTCCVITWPDSGRGFCEKCGGQ